MARVQRANRTQRHNATASGADAGTARLSGGIACGLRSGGERAVDTVATRVKQISDIGAACRHATAACSRARTIGRDAAIRAGSGLGSARSRSVPAGQRGKDGGTELRASIAAAGNGV